MRLLLGVAAVSALLGAACGDGGGAEDNGGTTSQEIRPGQATLLVSGNADTDQRDGVLTLREALLLATGRLSVGDLSADEAAQVEGQPGATSADDVLFAQPFRGDDAILLGSTLPPLDSGQDAIDGSSVGGVVIDGVDRVFTCLELPSSGNILRGMQIVGCRTGLMVDQEAEGNRIGGSGPGQGNVISGNVVGIELRGTGNLIQGNLIGLDASGTGAMGNEFEGIWATPVSRDNIIGGARPGEGNVVSGNDLFGISLDGAAGTIVQGNLFGLDREGKLAVQNKYGLTVQNGATGNLIGGEKTEQRNVIAGNNTGILLRDPATSGNTVRGNYLGTDISGGLAVRNSRDIWELEGVGQNLLEKNQMGPGGSP